ncbi:MAG TPA: hypothetical protein PK514_07250 [Spirochaetota bacterium]|nr:hypothetical protein [Spirochaetota bacterium]
MKFFKVTVIALTAVFISASLFSQSSIEKISDIDRKVTATYGDAVTLFKAETKKDVSLNYKNDEPLTRGMVALMTAKYLDLKGSFMYNIFGSQRYAVKACIAEDLMDADSSANDLMSGPELIEVLAKIAQRNGESE